MVVKKVLFCLSIAFFSLTSCMQDQPVLPEGVEIIENLPSDRWQEFKALRLKAATESSHAIGVTVADVMARDDADYRALLDKASKGESAWMIFAQNEEGLIAMAGALCVMNHLSTMRHVVKLISVYTNTRYRKKGVMSKMMHALLSRLKSSGITQVQVWVTQENENAIKLYEKLGFIKCGKLSNFIRIDDVFYNAYIMEKTLKAESSI